MKKEFVIGLDFGTDSARCLIADADTGEEMACATAGYRRWGEGKYCDPSGNRYRQHPSDYLEAMEQCVREALAEAGKGVAENVTGIGYDTTASTPVLTDKNGTPLALLPEFEEDPDAMFVLWKDHTAIREAEEINAAARKNGTDYTAYCGGSYSCEWVWAKMLHCLRHNPALSKAARSWTEHCDWTGGILTGNTAPGNMFRGRCTAGHKAMWNAAWGGLPDMEFFKRIDPLYSLFEGNLYHDTVTAGHAIGHLCREWAERLGLKEGTAVAMGAIDCHAGAVGAGIRPGVLVKVIGTSTCDIAVARPESTGGRIARGICGQADGSVIPGLTGYEAGQAAFGDIYAWYRKILEWPLSMIPEKDRKAVSDNILPMLNRLAGEMEVTENDPVASDWMNGRRTPDLDPNEKGCICGLTLSTDAPAVFKALVEATAYGARAIDERFAEEGVMTDEIVAVGGIPRKSPYVMQVLSDVLGKEIKVADSGQACALGSAIFAAVAAGIYKDIPSAQKRMQSGCSKVYFPEPEKKKVYDVLYARYRSFYGQTAR